MADFISPFEEERLDKDADISHSNETFIILSHIDSNDVFLLGWTSHGLG